MDKLKRNNIISVSFFITGNSVGSGLLALPICIGLVGVLPGIIIIFLGCIFMTATGLVLANIINERKDIKFDFPSIYESVLGKGFKWIAVIANLIVLYGLLVAYLSCLTEIAQSTFGLKIPVLPLFIFIIITSINFFALDIIKKSNALLVLILFVSFFILVILTGEHINIVNYEHLQWIFFPLSLPILVNSFNFHNVIPIVCRLSKFDNDKTYSAILLGVFFSFMLNLIWCIVVIGTLKYSTNSNTDLVYSYLHNLPATVPLGKLINTKFFDLAAVTFAVVAVITSYWTVGAALTGFIGDFKKYLINGENYFFNILLTFIPPLIITLICPNIFISIQNLVGGIGIAVLFGILPSIIFLLRSSGLRKLLPILMIIFFFIVIAISVTNSIGVVKYFD